MQTLIVKIKNEKKVAFTKELLKSFSFLEIEENKPIKNKSAISTKRKNALVQGFKELKMVEGGKIKTTEGFTFLKKLRNGKSTN
jgi:hypothetical protein